IKFTRVLLLFVMAGSVPVHAAKRIEVPWGEVCKITHGRQLEIRTADGDVVNGQCLSVSADSIAINSEDRKVVNIPRGALSRLQMHRREPRRLSSLGRRMLGGLRQSFEWL